MIPDPENFSPWLKTGSKVGETVDPSESRRNAKFRTEVLTEIRYNIVDRVLKTSPLAKEFERCTIFVGVAPIPPSFPTPKIRKIVLLETILPRK